MENFIQNWIAKYNVTPKEKQADKNRFFIAYGDIPLDDITVEEIYQAIDDPNVRLIYAKNAVRINNPNIWGNSYVLSISKKNYCKEMFCQINIMEEEKILLIAEKESLIMEIQEIALNMHALNYPY